MSVLLLGILLLANQCSTPWDVSIGKFRPGDTVKVTTTASWVNVRGAPGGHAIDKAPRGWVFVIVNGPTDESLDGEEYTWWQVNSAQYETVTSAITGWVAENLLELTTTSSLAPSSPPNYITSAGSEIDAVVNKATNKEGSMDWYNAATGMTYCLGFVAEIFTGSQSTGWGCPEDDTCSCPNGGKAKFVSEGKFYTSAKCWNPPKGALVFFSSAPINDIHYGHIGLCIGSGEVAHVRTEGNVSVDGIGDVVDLSYIYTYDGWAYPSEEWVAGEAKLQWKTMQSMPTPRAWAPAVVLGGKIYVVGGCSSSEKQQFQNEVSNLEVYDPALDSWAVLPSMPTPRVGPAAAAVGNKIYVIGGFNRSSWSANPVMEIYDVSSGTWSRGPDKPTPCSWAAAAVWHDKIYVLGGVGHGYLSTCEMFNPTTNRWRSCSSFSGGRYLSAAATVGDRIYLIGGDTWEPSHYKYADVQVYNPSTDSWTSASSMPTAETNLDAVVVDDEVWVFGRDDLCRIYNVAADSWIEIATDHQADKSFSVAYSHGKIYCFGGGGWGPTTDVVEAASVP